MVSWDRLCKALVYATAMSDPYVFSYYMATRPRHEPGPPEWDMPSSETGSRRHLRHALASLASTLIRLLSIGSSRSGVDVKTVSERFGHDDVQTTLQLRGQLGQRAFDLTVIRERHGHNDPPDP